VLLSARRLLAVRAIWIVPLALGVLLVGIIAVVYLGSVVDPASHLHGLPVLLVNEDRAAVGHELARDLERAPGVDGALAVRRVTLPAAERRMDDAAAYATVVLPPGLSAAVASGRPRVEVLTNVRNGSVGVSLATGALQPALTRLLARAASVSGSAVRIDTTAYRPLPANAALGSSPFYLALLTTMCGFLGATIVSSTIDSATGYATSETGPRWSQRVPVPITRWQTLLAKWGMAVVLVPLLTGLTVVVATLVVGVDVPAPGWLWLFMTYAALVVAFGTLTLLAIFGNLGQLLALVFFVYLAMAASGGTVPREALPTFFRWVSEIDPLRRILDGVRSLVYFDASLEAGLRAALVAATVGLVFWILLGALVTRWYDRRGFERLSPDVLARIQVAAAASGPEE
jgi:uncharacterized phage infection (PIP) family protein YhgE